MDAIVQVHAALETLVLRVCDDGDFVRVGVAPQWLAKLGKPSFEQTKRDDALDVFPILGVFLDDAEQSWRDRDHHQWTRSDFWTERASDGEEIHLAASAVRAEDGRFLLIQRDEQRFDEHRALLQHAREVRSALDLLGREMEQKEILVHCIVHDLSNPLGAIVAALSVLANRPLDRDTSDLVQLALDAANQQRGLIREILDVFAMERGAGGPHEQTLGFDDVRDAVNDAIATHAASAGSRGISLDAHFTGGNEPVRVLADSRRLERVAANLIDNAVRFSPDGARVSVTLSSLATGVRLEIDDEGPGVPPGFVTHLFQKFSRTNDREHPGTGLGLYFCRITVEQWGGAIGYAARAGGGARFWVELPRNEEAVSPDVPSQTETDVGEGRVATRPYDGRRTREETSYRRPR